VFAISEFSWTLSLSSLKALNNPRWIFNWEGVTKGVSVTALPTWNCDWEMYSGGSWRGTAVSVVEVDSRR